MTSGIIALILTILLAVFVVLGIIFGIGRGLVKSGVRLVWIGLTLVGCLFLCALLTEVLLNMNVSFLNLSYNGVEAHSIVDYAKLLVEDMTASTNVNTDNVAILAVALSSMVLNSILFPLSFFVLKYLLYPFYAIVARLICGKKPKRVKGEPKPKSKPKYRIAGGVIGGVTGLLTCAVVSTPIIGYMNCLTQINTVTAESSKDGVGLLTDKMGNTYNIIEDGYNNSAYKYVMRYTGMEALSKAMFNTVSTTKINGDKVSLGKEVTTLAKCYADFNKVINDYDNIKDFDQQHMDDYINDIESIVKTLFDSKLIIHAGDVVLPIAVDYLEDQKLTEGKKEYIKVLVDVGFDVVKNYKVVNLRNAVTGVLNVVKTVNNHRLLLPLLNKEVNSFDDIADKLTKEFAQELMDNLFAVDLVYELAPEVTNAILSVVNEQFDYGYEQVDELTKEQAKTGLTNLVVSAVDAIASIDNDHWMHYTPEHVSKIGALLDTIKDSPLIGANTYSDITTQLENKLKDVVDNIGVSNNIKNDIKVAIDNLGEVTNWTQEFTAIQNAVISLNSAIANDNNINKDVQDYDFESLGKAVDYMQTTSIFGEKIDGVDYTKQLVKDILSWLETKVMGDYAEDLGDTLTAIENNIVSSNYTWESALRGGESFFKTLAKMFDTNDSIVDQFKSNTSTLANDLGKALDEATGTPLFTGNTIKTFVSEILDIVKTSIVSSSDNAIDRAITNVVTNMQTNITNATTITWQTEFGHLKTLFGNSFDGLGLDNFEEVTTDIDNIISSNSVLITYNVVNSMLSEIVDDNLSEFDGDKYQQVITNISERIDTFSAAAQSTYTAEMNYLKSFKQLIEGNGTSNPGLQSIDITDRTLMGFFGTEFDKLKASYLIGDAGYVLVEKVLNDYVDDNSTSEYINVLTQVQANLVATKSLMTTQANYYAGLFVSLSDINTEVEDLKTLSITKDNLETQAGDIEATLDSLETNMLMRYNATREVMYVVLNKVQDVVDEYKVDAMGLTEALNILGEVETYITNYRTHLAGITSDQPYSSTSNATSSVSGANGVQINKPLTHITNMIADAKDIIDA